MRAVLMTLLMTALPAVAQPTTEFPEGATALTPDALKVALSDKSLSTKLANGTPVRLQYKANGRFYLNMVSPDGRPVADDGPWSVKDSALCVEGRWMRAGCSEVREKDGVLYVRRDNGQVVTYEAQ